MQMRDEQLRSLIAGSGAGRWGNHTGATDVVRGGFRAEAPASEPPRVRRMGNSRVDDEAKSLSSTRPVASSVGIKDNGQKASGRLWWLGLGPWAAKSHDTTQSANADALGTHVGRTNKTAGVLLEGAIMLTRTNQDTQCAAQKKGV